ncbi:hypothetical protein [Aidingimonas halophila]|uniref:Glyoxalase/Bleomycin resistance protein/Dioxygenase superfamily protein n=1 Tax=Aidingimonas halophila TaxID=574349 RepID=A0A1H3A3P5_9GAMM|nr:hypothetical protein [Aidingimonas halophila]GHC21510.1 hypothetical protein GCM10008094_10260 [Aidingimonas halophila]SDX24246.1 hypothetical protein SAMN05443545_104347 [Aidingimonas halophila]
MHTSANPQAPESAIWLGGLSFVLLNDWLAIDSYRVGMSPHGPAQLQEANVAIEYGPVSEPWGVRRFYVRDPFGRLINLLQHE